METFVSAALYVTSHTLSPAVISERLGLEPTRTQLKGAPLVDPSLLTGLSDQESELMREMPHQTPSHYFIVEVGHRVVKTLHDSSAQMLENLLEELLGKLEPVAQRLDQLQGQVSASLMCSYGSYHKPEWFVLSESLVRRIAALKLSVTVLLAPLEGEKERLEARGKETGTG
jgi:hypothetical protein